MAQPPFYTDDPAVTDRGKFHFEFYNEYDGLQRQFPNLRQNTVNYKLNYGLPHGLELDIDYPYLAIMRSLGNANSIGGGDLDLGIKWEYHKESPRVPALAASFYVEFPTGDAQNQLGSGLRDYWLNLIAQKSFAKKTRMNVNFGYLFAGNTGTGALGIESTRGHVTTAGLSLLHDFTDRFTMGVEAYGAHSNNNGLGREQLQFMVGSQIALREGLSLNIGVLGGRYVASPRLGAQVGFSVDLPDLWRPKKETPADVARVR